MKSIIYLIGFMGAGKSTIGALLAKRMNWFFVDIDELIEAQQYCSIAEIFKSRGEPFFRKIECQILQEISHKTHSIVATGGGIILRKSNREFMKKTGIQVWLQWEISSLLQHIQVNPAARPLFNNENSFINLYNKRRKWYAEADIGVQCDNKTPNEIVFEILQYLPNSNKI